VKDDFQKLIYVEAYDPYHGQAKSQARVLASVDCWRTNKEELEDPQEGSDLHYEKSPALGLQKLNERDTYIQIGMPLLGISAIHLNFSMNGTRYCSM
jgi:hypothetical protein